MGQQDLDDGKHVTREKSLDDLPYRPRRHGYKTGERHTIVGWYVKFDDTECPSCGGPRAYEALEGLYKRKKRYYKCSNTDCVKGTVKGKEEFVRGKHLRPLKNTEPSVSCSFATTGTHGTHGI